MKLNITPGPWIKSGYRAIGTTNTFKGENVDVICDTFYYNTPMSAAVASNEMPDYLSECEANAAAIVTAVNNTYHKGINPEAVPELLQLSKEIYNSELLNPGAQSRLKQIIQKATL